MGDNPRDAGACRLDAALQAVDPPVHLFDRKAWRSATVKRHDEAVRARTHPHAMRVDEAAGAVGESHDRRRDPGALRLVDVMPLESVVLQGLNMRLDFGLRSEFAADRGFEP